MARAKTIRAAKEAKAPRAKRAKKLSTANTESSSSNLDAQNDEQELTLENAALNAYKVLDHYALQEANIEGVEQAKRDLKQALGI